MRVKLFGMRFIFEVRSWRPLVILYGYVRRSLKMTSSGKNAQDLSETNGNLPKGKVNESNG
jgi:hypothetical protein